MAERPSLIAALGPRAALKKIAAETREMHRLYPFTGCPRSASRRRVIRLSVAQLEAVLAAALRLPHIPCQVADGDHTKCCIATGSPDPCGPCALGLALAALESVDE